MKTAWAFLIATGLMAGGAVFYTHTAPEPPPGFRTATVQRGDLFSTIGATGTVEPEEIVDVGAQVVGRVKTLGIDPSDPAKKRTIDYGSIVYEGTVLALIDDAIYQAQVDYAEATLQRAQADLVQCQAKLDQTAEEWKRAASLHPVKAIADTDYDLAAANYRTAVASVAGQKATVRQSDSLLRQAKTNLDYTIIRSPVQGIILDRRVNIGQTVVAALNVPSLFLIAKNLRRMQVWASVNESDIGRIHIGMPVRFTVDSYPDEAFYGKVTQIRLNATITQNVVTYTVVVSADNPDGKLLPYLTANLHFQVDRRLNVLVVPNAALRWRPRPQQMPPDVREPRWSTASGGGNDKDSASLAKLLGNSKPLRSAKCRDDRCRLWVEDGEFVRPVEVRIGVSDGSMTEVSGRNVKEGMDIVIGESGGDSSDISPPFPARASGSGQKS